MDHLDEFDMVAIAVMKDQAFYRKLIEHGRIDDAFSIIATECGLAETTNE